MKPLYYHYDQSSFVFASEVKAIIEDKKIEKEINWDGWRDFFSYGFLFGTKTLFKNVFALPKATILTLTTNEALFKTYWSYNQIRVDYESSEPSFVNKGEKLVRQAIERQTKDLEECIVLLSGGYDSRCIASCIKYFTDVNFETFTVVNGAFNPGNSGGPLFISGDNKIIGVVVSKHAHQDHRFVSNLTWNTFRDHFILEYEIPKYDGDLQTPNLYVHIDESVVQRKIRLISNSFQTQKEKLWFSEETFKSIMRIRGIESNSSSRYAEGFYCRKIVLHRVATVEIRARCGGVYE
jgi:hypothetical protein